MSFKRFYPFTVGCMLAVLMSVAPAVMGQVTNTQTAADRSLTTRSVPSGAKLGSSAGFLSPVRPLSMSALSCAVVGQPSSAGAGGSTGGLAVWVGGSSSE